MLLTTTDSNFNFSPCVCKNKQNVLLKWSKSVLGGWTSGCVSQTLFLWVDSFLCKQLLSFFFFSGVFVQFMWKLQSLQVMTGIARLDVTLLVWYLCLMAKPCVYRCFLSHRFLLWFKTAVHVNAQMSLHVLTSSLMQHCIKKKPCYNLILLVSLLLV